MDRIIEREIRIFLSRRILTAMDEFQRILLENTPVYTGRTLANFRWSVGAPTEGVRKPIMMPRLPGVTSTMSLGEEPRRAAQQALVQGEYESVVRAPLLKMQPFQKFYLTNNVPHFSEIEYGSYGEDARTPAAGITRAGESQIRAIIRGVTRLG